MQKIKNKFILTSLSMAFIIAVSLTGCKNDNVTDPLSSQNDVYDNNIGVGVFTENNDNDNTIIITSAKLVMRQLRLQVNGNETTEDIRTGPFVVYIDLYPRVTPIAIAKVPPGNYHVIKFQIHKPTPNEYISDPDFVESNGERYSFIIKGLYNGTPFIYKSQVTSSRAINIEGNPVFVVEGVTLYITLRVNPYSWFEGENGVLNPLDEGNWNAIDRNIKETFKRAYKDMDRNGEPD